MTNAVIAIRADTVESAIARRVQNLMWDYDLSAKDVADAAGLEYSGFSRRLGGKRGWSPDDIALVSYVLNVSVSYLFGEAPEPTPPSPEMRMALGARYPKAKQLPEVDSNHQPAG